MPADLFKKALESFRKRVIIIINLILAGHYECKPTHLEARVILICKDTSNSEFFSYYRPIALCNAFYQLVNIVNKNRLTVLVERYSVLESSQFGFGNSGEVQLVIQKATWLVRGSMKSKGTLIWVDLDFKNAFKLARHSCI